MKKLLLSFSILFIVSCGGGGGGGGVPFALTLVAGIFTTNEDTSLSGSIGATANEVVTLSYSITTPPSNGTLTLASGGSFTYEPSANFNGSDSFNYSVTASEKTVTKTGSASITINAVNDAPSISITQITPDDDTAYPLVISSTGLIEVALTLDDIDNENTALTLEASSTEGAVTLTYDSSLSTTSATIDLSQIALAGKVDITFTVSDGVDSSSNTYKLWYAKQQVTENEDIVYELFGNQADSNRLINKVIALDSLASDEIIKAARTGMKSFVGFIGENSLDYFINRHINILVAETPKGDESVLGVKVDCEGAADENIYCVDYQTYLSIYEYLGNYFSDIDEVSIITGIDGRGTAYPSYKLSFQDLLDSNARSVRNVVLTLKHEFGHTFSILGDEYTSDFENGNVDCTSSDDDDDNDYNCGRVDASPNISSEQTPEELRWKHHIADIDNVNGFDNTISTEGIGMYEGAYQGTDDVYRASYESIMNGYSIGTGYTDYTNTGTSSKGVQWDEVGQESFAIQTLKFQGLHGMSVSTDTEGNKVATQNLIVSSDDFHIDWYIDGVLDSSKRNQKSVTLEKKSSGFSTIAYRVSEVTPKFLKVTDDIHIFADAYRGLFSFESRTVLCSALGRPIYSSIEGYDEPLCRRTVYLVTSSGSSFWTHFDDLDDIKTYSNIKYFFETSALGELYGLDWSNQ